MRLLRSSYTIKHTLQQTPPFQHRLRVDVLTSIADFLHTVRYFSNKQTKGIPSECCQNNKNN